MIRLCYQLLRQVFENPWHALVIGIRLFSFTLIFFCVLAYSRFVDIGLPRYDVISVSLLILYSLFFLCRWRSRRDLLIHVTVHFTGLFFEVFKVSQLSWVYPEYGVLVFFGVPFYSGFMYTALVDFICQAMRLSQFRFTKVLPWKTITLLAILIYLNFFLVHIIRMDARYLLVLFSIFVLLRVPVQMVIKKTTIDLKLFSLMVVFSSMVWVAENLATWGGAWLYVSQLSEWILVSPHKIVSWYLLGQFFVFIVMFFFTFDCKRTLLGWIRNVMEEQPIQEK